MTKTKDKKFVISKSRIIIFTIILLLLLITIFYSKKIEIFINYRNIDITNQLLNQDLKVHFLDVEQGDCSCIELPDGKTFLIDSGKKEYSNRIINYLDNFVLKGNKKIDYFLITHPHSDHIGGASDLMNYYEIKNILRPNIYSASESSIKEYGDLPVLDNTLYNEVIDNINRETFNGLKSNIILSSSFFKIENDNYKIEFLSPNKSIYENLNNYSPIVLLTYDNKKIMFTGDAEEEIEQEIISSYIDMYEYLDIDILKVGHHGSDTSSSENFLKIVKPEYAVISVGDNNNYDMPNKNVLKRLEDCGINKKFIYRTDIQGNIITCLNKNEKIEVITSLKQNFPFYIYYYYFLIIAIILDFCIFMIPNKLEKIEK